MPFPPMRTLACLALLLATTGLLPRTEALAEDRATPDRYPGFARLAASERQGIDYRIRSVDRHTPVAIVAPHGGRIEPGTSEIADRIAGHDLSFYAFEGLRADHNRRLHITSTRFDEPLALNLVSGTTTVITLHGRADGTEPLTIWIGGLDRNLGARIAKTLADAGFRTTFAVSSLAGREPSNICNRGQSGAGVQMELPRTLRHQLTGNTATLDAFANAVRKAIVAERNATMPGKP